MKRITLIMLLAVATQIVTIAQSKDKLMIGMSFRDILTQLGNENTLSRVGIWMDDTVGGIARSHLWSAGTDSVGINDVCKRYTLTLKTKYAEDAIKIANDFKFKQSRKGGVEWSNDSEMSEIIANNYYRKTKNGDVWLTITRSVYSPANIMISMALIEE